MGALPNWLLALLVILVILVVVGLLAFARGQEHHRGDEVGALGRGAYTATVHG
jgi:hypothetical protein